MPLGKDEREYWRRITTEQLNAWKDKPWLRQVQIDLLDTCDHWEEQAERADQIELERDHLQWALHALRRAAGGGNGGCLDSCASWGDNDCDCGYIAAAETPIEFIEEVLLSEASDG